MGRDPIGKIIALLCSLFNGSIETNCKCAPHNIWFIWMHKRREKKNHRMLSSSFKWQNIENPKENIGCFKQILRIAYRRVWLRSALSFFVVEIRAFWNHLVRNKYGKINQSLNNSVDPVVTHDQINTNHTLSPAVCKLF